MATTERGGYSVLPKVYKSGIAETGLTAIVNDRDTVLTVPWACSNTGAQNIVWTIESDDGNTYRVTVPVTVAVTGSTSTISYTKGTYTRTVNS